MIRHIKITAYMVVILLFTVYTEVAASPYAIGRKESTHAFCFQMSEAEMRALVLGEVDTLSAAVLASTPVDTCRVEEVDTVCRGRGHWVWAWRTGAKLRFRIENNPGFTAKVYGETGGVTQVLVLDEAGRPMGDAVVKLGNNRLKYNEVRGMYECRTPKGKRMMYLTVEYGGDVQSFLYDKPKEVKYAEEYHYHRRMPEYHHTDVDNQLRMSYMATDKPIYRPGDTIRWKAVIMNVAGKWLDAEYNLSIQAPYSAFRKVLGKVSGSSVGVFGGDVHLADSLELRADMAYFLVLSDDKGRVMTPFSFEDYELKGLNVAVSAPAELVKDDTCVFSIKSVDEKGDDVTSGEIELTLTPGYVSAIGGESIFVPDTLYSVAVPMDVSGTTEVEIPASAFYEADMNVLWSVKATNAVYESVVEYGSFDFKRKTGQKDEERGAASDYLQIEKWEVADSVGFDVKNESEVPFRYAIYRDNKLVVSDYISDELSWRAAAPKSSVYSIVVDYRHGTLRDDIYHRDTDLRIRVEQQKVIAPGAETQITLWVTDSKGRAVADADVTAWSHTAKFKNRVPLPSQWTYDGKRVDRLGFFSITNRVADLKPRSLDNAALRTLFETNVSQYYALLTPGYDTPFVHAQKTDDGGSQIAPFVVRDGDILPVEVVYIDSHPVYVGWATNKAPYSFAVKAGRHTVAVRTADALYTVRDVEVEPDAKVWLSIAAIDKVSERKLSLKSSVERTKMPAYLTPTEAEYFRKWCVMNYKVFPLCGLPYIETNDGHIVSLEGAGFMFADNGTALVPRLTGFYHETSVDSAKRLMPWRFLPDAQTYIVPSQPLLLARQRCGKQENQKLTNRNIPLMDDSVLTKTEMKNRWMEYIDQRRYYYSFVVGKDENRGRCSLSVIVPEGVPSPINIMLEDGGIRYINGGNQRMFYGLHSKRYVVKLLYPDMSIAVKTVDVMEGGRNYLSIGNVDREVTGKSVELTDFIRQNVEQSRRNRYDENTLYDSMAEITMDDVDRMTYATKRMPLAAAAPANGGRKSKKETTVVMTDEVVFEEAAVETEVIDLVQVAAEGEAWSVQMRADFSDVAYWQPALHTDSDGKVSFTVKYPDDLTAWNEYFVAMKGCSRGWAKSQVVTRKDVVATLTTPRFAIEGDTIEVIGQGINYSDDSVVVGRRILLGDNEYVSLPDTLLTSTIVDATQLAVSGMTDSMGVSYIISGTSISDGERRMIPVYRKGMEAIEGQFHLLSSGDTSIVLKPQEGCGMMSLRLMGDMTSVLMDEVQKIKQTKHESNDMLASTLIALLAQQKVDEFRGTKFSGGSRIKAVIRKLEANRQSDFLWSWWGKTGKSSVWVTNHVYTALVRAAEAGYRVDALSDSRVAVHYFVKMADKYASQHDFEAQLQMAQILTTIGFRNEAAHIITSFSADSVPSGDGRLLHHLLSARLGMLPSMSVVDSIRHKDMLGGEFYAFRYDAMPVLRKIYIPESYRRLETTLLVYDIWAAQPESQERDEHLRAISRWLLRQRRTTGWGSVYQSARIVNAVLPICFDTAAQWQPLEVSISSGGVERSYTQFPCYIDSIDSDVVLTKSGNSELYISADQRYFVPQPETRKAEFSVDSRWSDSIINQGVETELIVTVSAADDAEYVVIEIPIPAGCTYADRQPYTRGEVHREQLRHCVNIYCSDLEAGQHEFRVRLLPRFTGRYTVNPAQVEMIYFPSFNANNTITSVAIK